MPNLLGLSGATHTSIPWTWPCQQQRCCWQCCSPPTTLGHSVCPTPPLIMRHNAVSRPPHTTCEESFIAGKEELCKHVCWKHHFVYFVLCSPERTTNFHLTKAAENVLNLAVSSDWFVRFSTQRLYDDHNWQQFNNNTKTKIELQPYKSISSVNVLRGRTEKSKEKPARPLITNLVQKGKQKSYIWTPYISFPLDRFSYSIPLLFMPFTGSQCLSHV